MIDLKLFARKSFTMGISSGFLSYLVLFGTLFVIPFYLEHARHLSPATAGIELSVLPLLLCVVAPFAGQLADRIGARPLTVSGMMLVGCALVCLGITHPTTLWRLIELGVVGIGLGLFTAPNNAGIMSSAPRSQSGQASGILNMTRGAGTAVGLALTELVFSLVSGRLHATSVTNGFGASAVFLGVIAGCAAVISALRTERPADRAPESNAEKAIYDTR